MNIWFQCDTTYCKCRNFYSNEIDRLISCVGIGLMLVFNDDGLFVHNVMNQVIAPKLHYR